MEKDWSKTALGGMKEWPQSLLTSVNICLNSRFPILIWWGEELIKIYNDSYIPILSEKHPFSLGSPGRKVWPEIWVVIGPMLKGVMKNGEATWSENQLLLLNRDGYTEECYFTFSYSPIHVETGGVGGVFCAVTETTAGVLDDRHLRTLRQGKKFVSVQSVRGIYETALHVLAENPYDFPFSVIYSVDEVKQTATMAGSTGFTGRHDFVCQEVGLSGDDKFSKLLSRCLESNTAQVEELSNWSGVFPRGAWDVAPREALVLPVILQGKNNHLR